MMKEYIIDPCSGIKADVRKGQLVIVEDTEGGQVADFFAEAMNSHNEFLSPGVTMDCNESLRLNTGDILYTNLYRPMFSIISDDVGEHDLIHPCCRKEMYDFFYHNGENHPNCLDNINRSLGTEHPIIHPVNLFMHTRINTDGSIEVMKPVSKAGDRIVFRAEMDARIGIAACSVSESDCNSGRCTSLRLMITDAYEGK